VPERALYAAIDLGSNSFHMIVARHEQGQLRVIDRIRDMVRLAGGLDDQGQLDPSVRAEALDCLARFGQRIRDIPQHHLRAVGTQTFRRLSNPASFLVIAETALGCPIDIISGREEARLVYLGVSQGMAPVNARRLVLDIGGGSTEIVVGQTQEPALAESLAYGCVSLTRMAFPDGRITASRWHRYSHEIGSELQAYASQFREHGWAQAVGTSGTIRAVSSILTGLDNTAGDKITPDALDHLKKQLIESGNIDRIDWPGLSERRRPVIAAGILILEAMMDGLSIQSLQVSPFALREGVLHDLLGRLEHRDPREKTVKALAERYQADLSQAARVDDWSAAAFEQVAESWLLNPVHADFLHWICQLHEIGLSIAHDSFALHTAYILDHTDMPGFSRQEQQFLAVLARLQRGRIDRDLLNELPTRLQSPARRLLVLLRLATIFCRARSDSGTCDFAVHARSAGLRLELPAGWLEAHPLTRRDLSLEQEQWQDMGFELELGHLEAALS
jgi:exopolyphosphatase / guanosine-5'-triphosphate,3'-diphosphate pyrophosphatase